MRGRLALAVLALSIGACTPWPDPVSFSEELLPDDATMQEQALDGQQLGEQFRRLDLELDVLVLHGANDCLPAHVVSAETMATRLHNELRVGLYQDAISDLAVFSKQLDELRRRLEYLGEHTRCHEPYVDVAEQPAEDSVNRIAEIKDWPGSLRLDALSARTTQ